VPRREDERYANLTGRHPAYCTCVQCTDKFLKKKGIRGKKSLFQRLLAGNHQKRHPANCSCATCNLLRSVAAFPAEAPPANKTVTKPGGGLFSKLFGKK
jgi:hypothetical protein